MLTINHSLGSTRSLLRRLHHQHPPMHARLRTFSLSLLSLHRIVHPTNQHSNLQQIPGLLHSWYIISKFPEVYEYEEIPQDGERGSNNGRVTYVFVQPERQPQPKPTSPSHPNYGGTGQHSNAAAGSSSAAPHNDEEGRAPPTYAEAVKGDNKVQTHD